MNPLFKVLGVDPAEFAPGELGVDRLVRDRMLYLGLRQAQQPPSRFLGEDMGTDLDAFSIPTAPASDLLSGRLPLGELPLTAVELPAPVRFPEADMSLEGMDVSKVLEQNGEPLPDRLGDMVMEDLPSDDIPMDRP